MKDMNLIILAGGKRRDWHVQYNASSKACLPIAGKPMLDWVIQSFHKSALFQNIVVVGGQDLDNLAAMRFVKKRIAQGFNLLQNLFHAAFYLKFFVFKMGQPHSGYFISFCDAPLLTPEIIKATIGNIIEADADIVIHYVEKSVIEKAGLPAQNRSYMTIAGKQYTGTNIYYIRKFSLLLKCLKHIGEIRKVRKNPDKILEYCGCAGEGFAGIDRVLSEKLNAKVRILTSPFAEMGVDVDKPADYELANQLLVPEPETDPSTFEEPAAALQPVKNGYWGFAKLACWLLAIAAVGSWSHELGIKEMFLHSLNWIGGFGTLAPFMFTVIYLILAGIFLPSFILKVGAGFLFGVVQGTVLVTIGSTISSVIKFFLARYWCRDVVKEKIKENPQWQAIDGFIEKKGWKILALLRNIPILSSMFLNYICGLSSMRLKDFILATSIGHLPSNILYVYLGCLTNNIMTMKEHSYEQLVVEWALFLFGLGMLILFALYCRKLLKENRIQLPVRTPAILK